MDKQLYSANDLSTSCTNIVNFGPVTPDRPVAKGGRAPSLPR